MTWACLAATAADEVMLQTVIVQWASQVAVTARRRKDAVVAKHLRRRGEWVGGGGGASDLPLPTLTFQIPAVPRINNVKFRPSVCVFVYV